MIIDMREYIFNNSKAHKAWSKEIKENSLLKDNIGKITIIGKNALAFRTEKEMLET